MSGTKDNISVLIHHSAWYIKHLTFVKLSNTTTTLILIYKMTILQCFIVYWRNVIQNSAYLCVNLIYLRYSFLLHNKLRNSTSIKLFFFYKTEPNYQFIMILVKMLVTSWKYSRKL